MVSLPLHAHVCGLFCVSGRAVPSSTCQNMRPLWLLTAGCGSPREPGLLKVNCTRLEPRWRLCRDLVTLEAEPDEEQVYGGATPVMVEWRKAKAEHSEAFTTGTALDKADAKIRLMDLEIALIEEHELTLPPASYPRDRSTRRNQVRRHRRSLADARAD